MTLVQIQFLYLQKILRSQSMMMRVAIIGSDGKIVSPQDISTAADLRDAATLAKALADDCERLAMKKAPKPNVERHRDVPYST